MTARNADWNLVGYGSDPIPASEIDIDNVAREMKSRADAARDVKDVLKNLAELDGWRGQAATAFAGKAEEVLDNLGKVVERYDAVSEALYTWGDDVGEARRATWTAVQNAETAQSTIDSNEKTTPLPGEELTDAEESANEARSGAQEDLEAARSAVQTAMENLDDAANRAKDRIEDAADIWDDGMFQGLKNWIRANADWIDALVTILEWAAIIIAAALLIAVIFFTAPAWLIGLAIGVAALTLVLVASLAFADTGKRDWGDVAWAAVGLVLTIFGGKLASAAMRGVSRLVPQVATRVGSQAASTTRAAWSTRLANWPAYQNASRITNPANNLARWATQVRVNMATAVTGADDAARAAVTALDNAPTTSLQRLLTQDAGLASARNTLNALKNLGLQGDEIAQAARATLQMRGAIGAGGLGLGHQGQGIPGTIGDTIDLFRNPPWSSR